MELIIREIVNVDEKQKISEEILNDLPQWFGIEKSTKEYVDNSNDKNFLACFTGDEVIGFVVLNATSKDCAEIYVMGVKRWFHRIGVGKALNEAYEKMAKIFGYTYSQDKTVKMGCYQQYDITNKFYISIGYKELECFPNLWDKWNPCQIYVKYLGE